MDQDSSWDELTFHFIRDEPAQADSFGSHSRLAASIAKVITQNVDLKVIGLLGPWGAGKSTVVHLVQKALEEDAGNNTYCFSYDAWLHQADPPRRAFLETLIHFLIKKELTTPERWQPRLAQLNRQIEETEITSTPTLTTSGRAIAFSLLLWPIALPLLGHDWYAAAFKAHAPLSDIWPFWFGVFLILLPFLILFGFYVSWRPVKSPFKREFWRWANFSTHKSPHETESILSLFINKEVQRQRNRVTRAPDPTTIEFQDIFREIMEAVKGDKHRFLFVIDNLDRLPEADAVAMWGTIRSFFLGAHETNHVRKAAAMPTVILPIDEAAVRRMYNVSHGPDDAEGLAKSFMDKTFDLTFRVTRPVLSDWNSYLAQQMKNVFGPAMPPEWPYVTGRLYERYFVGQSEPNVTPRTVNTLINAIASLWLQWRGGGVSFAAVAYYCIFRETIDQNILGAVGSRVAAIADLDPDWQRGVAALHYGAPPGDAAQILIEQPLRKAITEKDSKGLAQLRGMPSFERVLLRIFDQFAVDGIDPVAVLNAAIMLQSLGDGNELWRNEAWRRLHASFRATAPWRQFGLDEANGVKALAEHCPADTLGLFLTTLNAKLAALDPGTVKEAGFVTHFIDAWRTAFAAAQSAKQPLPPVQVPGAADVFLNAAATCRDTVELLKLLSTTVDDVALVQEFAATVGDQARAATAENKFLALRALDRSFEWGPLVTACVAVVRDQNANHPGMAAALRILGTLRASNADARNQIQPLVNDGQLVARLNEGYSQQRDEVVARALALLLLGGNRNIPVPDGGNWTGRFTQRSNLAAAIDNALIEFDGPNNLQLLVDMATGNGAWLPIARGVVSLRVQAKKLGALPLEPIISNLPQYLACVDDPLQESFMAQVARDKTFWDKLSGQPFDGPVLTFLRALIKEQDATGERARVVLRERLDGVDTATWNAAVRKQSEPWTIAAELAAVGATVEIGSPLYDALQGMIGDILKSADMNLRTRWFGAQVYLAPSAQQTLSRNLRDAILSAPSVVQLPALLAVGGQAFTQTAGFAEKSDDCVRHIVLPLLADAAGVAWIAEHAGVVGEWVRAALPATAEFLNDRLGKLLEATGDQTRKDALQSLRDAWSPANDAAETVANDKAATS